MRIATYQTCHSGPGLSEGKNRLLVFRSPLILFHDTLKPCHPEQARVPASRDEDAPKDPEDVSPAHAASGCFHDAPAQAPPSFKSISVTKMHTAVFWRKMDRVAQPLLCSVS